jgi:Polyketide cyclase / dehydrase and lipid transport
MQQTWTCEHTTETLATPETIWRLFTEVATWPRWNAGVEKIEMTEPFATGATFTMTVPGQPPLTTRLLDVRERSHFVDETVVGDLSIIVTHTIQPAAAGRTRIAYALRAQGPGCDEVGPAISSDFPEVLAALVAVAEAEQR